MPVTTIPNPKVDLLSFQDLLEYATNNLDEYETQYQLLSSISADLRNNPYIQGSLTTEEAWANEIYKKLRDAGYEVEFNGNGTWTGSAFSTQPSITTQNPVNSNISTISSGNLRTYYGGINEYGVSQAKTWQPVRFPFSGGLGSRAMYLLGSVASGVGAVATGISLGKVISPLLYDAMPDVWENMGISEGAFEPEAWNSITNGSDSPFAGLFNFILGLDPDTGDSQMYMNENAFAYMAYALSQNGWFGSGGDYYEVNEDNVSNVYADAIGLTDCHIEYAIPTPYSTYIYNDVLYNLFPFGYSSRYGGYMSYVGIPASADISTLKCGIIAPNPTHMSVVYSLSGSSLSSTLPIFRISSGVPISAGEAYPSVYTNAGFTSTSIPSSMLNEYVNIFYSLFGIQASSLTYTTATTNTTIFAWLMQLGDAIHHTSAPEGITNQEGATLPDVSTWNDIPSTLQSLQQQYPNLFQDPMVWNTDDPASPNTGDVTRYIPVPFPALDANGNPYSSTQTQTATQLDNSTTPTDVLDLLMKTIQQTETQTQPQDVTPPSNPTDVGTGTSPIITPPSGSASALWAVYHPTQAQVNSFGAWLWSSSFVDQLLKVFQNPMDAIISLHKVFISPIDAGSTTIHAGYLDSNVPSNYVTQQYVYADCGYVDCYEVFGNVFDYVGTSISLYLPFIGIVPLNVDEVMRSTIHVTYGCDLFTGAILVQVEISRDGNDVVMYQYGGDGGVQYPVSGSRSGGFLTGLAATIGAAASIATGGAALPAFAAAFGGSVMSAQKQVQHSGGFSGNSGAMGGKTPYLIIERPQTKVAQLFPSLSGYPTNKSGKLSDFEGQVVVSSVHVEGMTATDTELSMIEDLLKEGILL